MRLIDADALLEHAGVFEAKACARGCGKSILNLAKAWLLNEVDIAPTIDAVPVVRCKDCKHWDEPYCMLCKTRIGAGYLSRDMAYRKPDDFCSYGERKDGDG